MAVNDESGVLFLCNAKEYSATYSVAECFTLHFYLSSLVSSPPPP